jgi:hypothetical protein
VFSCPESPHQLWGPPSLMFNGQWDSFSGVNWQPRHEADHLAPSSSLVKSKWSYTFTPSTCLYGADSDNFTSFLPLYSFIQTTLVTIDPQGCPKKSVTTDIHYIQGLVEVHFKITFKLIPLKLRLFSVLMDTDMNRHILTLDVSNGRTTHQDARMPSPHSPPTVLYILLKIFKYVFAPLWSASTDTYHFLAEQSACLGTVNKGLINSLLSKFQVNAPKSSRN